MALRERECKDRAEEVAREARNAIKWSSGIKAIKEVKISQDSYSEWSRRVESDLENMQAALDIRKAFS